MLARKPLLALALA